MIEVLRNMVNDNDTPNKIKKLQNLFITINVK